MNILYILLISLTCSTIYLKYQVDNLTLQNKELMLAMEVQTATFTKKLQAIEILTQTNNLDITNYLIAGGISLTLIIILYIALGTGGSGALEDNICKMLHDNTDLIMKHVTENTKALELSSSILENRVEVIVDFVIKQNIASGSVGTNLLLDQGVLDPIPLTFLT